MKITNNQLLTIQAGLAGLGDLAFEADFALTVAEAIFAVEEKVKILEAARKRIISTLCERDANDRPISITTPNGEAHRLTPDGRAELERLGELEIDIRIPDIKLDTFKANIGKQKLKPTVLAMLKLILG
jgi:hypothetical protein